MCGGGGAVWVGVCMGIDRECGLGGGREGGKNEQKL